MAAEEKSLYGMYTRMLRKATIVHWSSHTKNEALYGKLPKLSNKIAAQRLLLVGHCFRHSELITHTLIFGSQPTDKEEAAHQRSTVLTSCAETQVLLIIQSWLV